MRYSCNDIRNLLDNCNLDPEDQGDFISHLETCSSCASLIAPEPDLETLLTARAFFSPPASIEESVLAGIRKYERGYNRAAKLDRLFFPVFGIFAVLPIATVVVYWESIRAFLGSVKLDRVYDAIPGFLREIRIPDLDFSGIADVILNSPFLILTLISITATLWAFSIAETQKSLK